MQLSQACNSHRHKALTGHISHRCASYISVQLSQGIHLTGVRLRQACNSYRTYVLNRRAALTGHAFHKLLDFGANGQVGADVSGPPHPRDKTQNEPGSREIILLGD